MVGERIGNGDSLCLQNLLSLREIEFTLQQHQRYSYENFREALECEQEYDIGNLFPVAFYFLHDSTYHHPCRHYGFRGREFYVREANIE